MPRPLLSNSSTAWIIPQHPPTIILNSLPQFATTILTSIMPSVSAQLVAVAAASDRIDGSAHFRGTELLDGRSRSNPILDTLASICVRKGKSEAYAVAMQLYENKDGSGGGKLTLTISGNSGVPPEVVSHLQSVLSQLQAIAARCHAFHKDRGMPYPLKYNKTRPPVTAGLAGRPPSSNVAIAQRGIGQGTGDRFNKRTPGDEGQANASASGRRGNG